MRRAPCIDEIGGESDLSRHSVRIASFGISAVRRKRVGLRSSASSGSLKNQTAAEVPLALAEAGCQTGIARQARCQRRREAPVFYRP